ncbi:MAG TPA: hypothetical protein VFC38_00600 [Stellaceae bacterium]|nr:hypothetical protein [Stellaceae bacterium]
MAGRSRVRLAVAALRQAGQRQDSAASGIGWKGSFMHQQSPPGLQSNSAPQRAQRDFAAGAGLEMA